MNRNKQLAKNTIILMMGKVCTQFVSFFLLPLYTSLLTASDYGIIDLLQSYIILFVPVISLRLETSVFRFLIDDRDNKQHKINIISNTIIFTILVSLVFSFLYLVLTRFLSFSFKYLVFLNIIAMIFSGILLQISRGLGNNLVYSIASFITAVSTIILNIILLLLFKLGAASLLVSSFIANIICIIYIFIKLKLYDYIKIKYYNTKIIKDLVRYSLPMIPNGISWWIINVSDRSIISLFIDISANGIYSISNKFSGIFVNIYNIFNLSWSESASLHINDEDRDEFFSNTISSMFKLFSCICLGIIACMPFVFFILIDSQYNEAYNYIPILLVSNLFNVLVGLLSAVYIAKKLTKEIAKTSMIAAIINIMINLIFIKFIGLYAASISTLISFMVVAIYRYIDVQKYVKIKLEEKLILNTITLFIISIYLYYLNNIIGNIINLLMVCIYSLITNREFISSILNSVRKLKFIKHN